MAGAEETISVKQAFLPSGGFVVIHDETLVTEDDAPGSVVGTSEYLDPGNHVDVEVTLDNDIVDADGDGERTLIAMPHRDTNSNQEYEFPKDDEGILVDTPYTRNGSAVIDAAPITVEDD